MPLYVPWGYTLPYMPPYCTSLGTPLVYTLYLGPTGVQLLLSRVLGERALGSVWE